MSRNAESFRERLEADRQQAMRECPGFHIWWIYGADARVTWHASRTDGLPMVPVSADSASGLVNRILTGGKP